QRAPCPVDRRLVARFRVVGNQRRDEAERGYRPLPATAVQRIGGPVVEQADPDLREPLYRHDGVIDQLAPGLPQAGIRFMASDPALQRGWDLDVQAAPSRSATSGATCRARTASRKKDSTTDSLLARASARMPGSEASLRSASTTPSPSANKG